MKLHWSLRLREIAREVLRVNIEVSEELFDQLGFVTRRQNKLVVAKTRVIPHQMPKDGHRPNRNHRLGHKVGRPSKPSPESASQDHYFHTFSDHLRDKEKILKTIRRPMKKILFERPIVPPKTD
jgi:hypothetical protein